MRQRVTAAVIVALVFSGFALTQVNAQDITTQLSKFLVDLRNGAWGSTQSVTSVRLTSGVNTATLTGTGAGTISLTGTTPMIQLGGTSSSFPAWLRSGTSLVARLADDSADTAIAAASVSASGNGVAVNASGAYFIGNTRLISATAVSAPTSCGTSPVVTAANGTASFVVTGGTGGAATGCTITMPAATTGWNCSVVNLTQVAAHRADRATVFTGSTTTSASWEYVTVSTGAATAFTASDVFRGICFAY